MQRDEQGVQGGGLVGAGDGLALQLQLAERGPVHAVQGGAGAHVPQQHQQRVALLVFDWLEVRLAQVMDSQHALGRRACGWWRASSFPDNGFIPACFF